MEPTPRFPSQFRVTVEPVAFLFTLGYTLQQCIQQDFIFKRLCLARFPGKVCDGAESFPKEVEEVQKKAVNHVMWISIITSITAIVSSQFIGYAMDKYSRKVLLLMPFVGALLQAVLSLLVASSPIVPLHVLYLGAALLGLSGGYVIFKSGTSSYVANICHPEERVARLAILEALGFLGNAAGPIILIVVVD
ncbi:proton-coupled folate transporter-like, partial [Oratosquilla oratoria]|uniref:proton-coupled folate transporter-like n=1 Tax=Oratosquilla oratoria TaxID=337810 RepID=UPI003F777747